MKLNFAWLLFTFGLILFLNSTAYAQEETSHKLPSGLTLKLNRENRNTALTKTSAEQSFPVLLIIESQQFVK